MNYFDSSKGGISYFLGIPDISDDKYYFLFNTQSFGEIYAENDIVVLVKKGTELHEYLESLWRFGRVGSEAHNILIGYTGVLGNVARGRRVTVGVKQETQTSGMYDEFVLLLAYLDDEIETGTVDIDKDNGTLIFHAIGGEEK